ncbi:MAG: glycosyltransferase family 39 protein [Sedimentisphaerales bacterium]|nr:glycosyltransferase family 39 protein [Sedimentisphaerales bacterium]
MSHRRRRKESARAVTPPSRTTPGIKQSGWIFVGMALAVAALFFLLGKYMELGSPGPFDSAAYVYSAEHLLQGARMDIEEKGSAKPATLLINVIGVGLFGFNDYGPKIIQGLLQLLALTMMFIAMRKWFGSVAACLGVILASYYLSAPLIAKYGNVKEQYMIALMVIGISALMLYESGGKPAWAILTGAMAANVYYIKETGVSMVAAVLLYLIVGIMARRIPWRSLRKEGLHLLVGGTIGLVPLAGFYVWQGKWTEFLYTFPAAILQFLWFLIVSAWALVIWLKHRRQAIHKLRTVRRSIWWIGFGFLGILFVGFSIYFLTLGEWISYLEDLPGVRFVQQICWRLGKGLDFVKVILFSPNQYWKMSRTAMGLTQQAPMVCRYYAAVIVPVFLGLLSLAAGIVRMILHRTKRHVPDGPDRFVLLLGVWWLLDMALVWISPRSYEQYYLPLTASGAMLGGYIIWLYVRGFQKAIQKGPWLAAGAVATMAMIAMAWPIFFGLNRSRFSGQMYKDGRRNGYIQRLEEVKARRIHPMSWEAAGDYIRQRSSEEDTIYVWGWVPGIYVRSQRLSCTPRAFESDMHVTPPQALYYKVQGLVADFEKGKPKFIVDSRKQHFPWDRLPLELWPSYPPFQGVTRTKFVPNNEQAIRQYDLQYSKALAEQIDPDEARRYESMAPLRDFIRTNYEIVQVSFGEHVLFRRKDGR